MGYPFLDLVQASLTYIVNLEMDKSPKWVLFNIVSSQITWDVVWK